MKKVCSTCREEKELGQYSRDKTRPNGLSHRCKTCAGKLVTKWRNENRKRYNEIKYKTMRKYPEHQKAYNRVRSALRDGRLTKAPCEVCQTTERVQAHHEDYTKPLEVNWLCPKHHMGRHKELLLQKTLGEKI